MTHSDNMNMMNSTQLHSMASHCQQENFSPYVHINITCGWFLGYTEATQPVLKMLKMVEHILDITVFQYFLPFPSNFHFYSFFHLNFLVWFFSFLHDFFSLLSNTFFLTSTGLWLKNSYLTFEDNSLL